NATQGDHTGQEHQGRCHLLQVAGGEGAGEQRIQNIDDDDETDGGDHTGRCVQGQGEHGVTTSGTPCHLQDVDDHAWQTGDDLPGGELGHVVQPGEVSAFLDRGHRGRGCGGSGTG